MKFDLSMKLSAIIIIAFGIFLNVKIADAKMSGECWQGGSISEQSSVGCRYLQNKKYHGLQGFRHSRELGMTSKHNKRTMGWSGERKLRWGISIPGTHE